MLELPGDVAREEFEGELTYKPVKGWRSSADPGDVKKGVRALREAKNPVIYAGQGVLYAEAWDELRMLSEALQIPVLTTMTGKSAFPENHPLSLGLAAHVRTPAAKHFLERADLVFSVGAGLSRHWMQSPIPKGTKILQLTNCAYDIGKGYPVDYAILGDAKLALSQMLKETEEGPRVSEKEDMLEEIKAKKEEWYKEWEPLLTSNEKPINPVRVIWDLMNTVDRENTIVTPESGKPRDHMSTTYQAITPRSYLGFGHSTTLGFTLGCAMGAKLAEPDKLVVNVMGDGAFGMVGMDVETAVREEIPILTIILNNSTLSTIGMFPTANRVYKTGAMTGNYADLAESLGAHGERVEDPDEVVPAIKRCIQKVNSGKPCLLEFITKLESKVSR
jgi:acetolactate synthase-1/2/3 large subunit